jgi:saccharopine dehydrogenase-like NADP-dependent oxidoreductase
VFTTKVGVLGAGVTGVRVVEHLRALGHSNILVSDKVSARAQRLSALHSTNAIRVEAVTREELFECTVVVLAFGAPHAHLSSQFIQRGVSVVSLSDNVADCMNLLALDAQAKEHKTVIIVGAASSPGATGLLLRSMTDRFDTIDEAHVAMHGTGGPECARQHHDALSGQSIGWHDDEWLRRPSGSGRELCWFPEPVGAYDCYRAELPDPVLLKKAMPELERLPMLAPPHAEGGMGAVRIEVRGNRGGSRIVEIAGIAERIAQLAGVVSAASAHAIATGGVSVHGARVLGEPELPNAALLELVLASGVRLHQFVGA